MLYLTAMNDSIVVAGVRIWNTCTKKDIDYLLGRKGENIR